MTAEAAFSVTGKVSDLLVTIRGDSFEEFVHNANQALGAGHGSVFATEVFIQAVGSKIAPALASVAVLPAQPASTIGAGIVAPPLAVPQAAPVAAAAPPTVAYPGDCPHGVRVYVDKPARGKPWQRWECATPWTPQTKDSRCKPINCN